MAATHNHSSPMYSSTSWGVWAFQDVFDIRFYEYMARQMADAVEEAGRPTDDVEPGLTRQVAAARPTTTSRTATRSARAIADDGTPAGYPQSDTTTT